MVLIPNTRKIRSVAVVVAVKNDDDDVVVVVFILYSTTCQLQSSLFESLFGSSTLKLDYQTNMHNPQALFESYYYNTQLHVVFARH